VESGGVNGSCGGGEGGGAGGGTGGAGDGRRHRKQLKTARKQAHTQGLRVNLRNSNGRIDTVPTYRPYDANAFDELVVYHFEWTTKLAHVWRIPAATLVDRGFLRTADQPGRQVLYVYTSAVLQSNTGKATRICMDRFVLYWHTIDCPSARGHCGRESSPRRPLKTQFARSVTAQVVRSTSMLGKLEHKIIRASKRVEFIVVPKAAAKKCM
jgi:hypothetical protein